MLLRMEEVGRSFEEALQNAWLVLKFDGGSAGDVQRSPRPAGLQSPVSGPPPLGSMTRGRPGKSTICNELQVESHPRCVVYVAVS